MANKKIICTESM